MSELPSDDNGLATIVSVIDVFLGSMMLMLAILSVVALGVVIREIFKEMFDINIHNWFHKVLEKAHLAHVR